MAPPIEPLGTFTATFAGAPPGATDVVGGFQAWRAAGLPVDR